MKKENIYKFLYFLSALLFSGFTVRISFDIYKYQTTVTGSAPLYAYLLIAAIEYLIPGIALFVAAMICKRKLNTKNTVQPFQNGRQR